MANKLFKDVVIKIDDAAGSLTAITAYVSSESIRGQQDTLEDTSLADEERSYLFGLAGSSFSLAGFVNSTTDGIFGPLVGNRTTATKTYQVTAYSGSVYRGEVLITSVEYSGSAGTLETFSAEGTFDGVMTKTSVAL
jgi:hypothetical protein